MMDMDAAKSILIDKLIHIRQNNEIMYRGLAPCTIVLGITDHEFRDIMDAAIFYLMHKDDSEPVRRGRWNYRHEDDWCYCTACGTDAEGSDGECLETDYCPHCGARMYGGADDAT